MLHLCEALSKMPCQVLILESCGITDEGCLKLSSILKVENTYHYIGGCIIVVLNVIRNVLFMLLLSRKKEGWIYCTGIQLFEGTLLLMKTTILGKAVTAAATMAVMGIKQRWKRTIMEV